MAHAAAAELGCVDAHACGVAGERVGGEQCELVATGWLHGVHESAWQAPEMSQPCAMHTRIEEASLLEPLAAAKAPTPACMCTFDIYHDTMAAAFTVDNCNHMGPAD